MSNLKRDNWTNEEVIKLLDGSKVTRADGTMGEKQEWHNEGVDSCIECFLDFKRPVEEAGAMAFIVETGEVVHVGPLLPA